MAPLDPAVAATRVAVREVLDGVPGQVLVACSGGADSLVLAAAAGFVAPRLGLSAGLVTVDHGLQDGSRGRADAVAAWARSAGLEPVEVLTVAVGDDGGPEAAARAARYAALDAAAERLGAAAVLLGHTRDDQAETVLLALARGAGPRGLSGMPVRRGRYLRPFLDLPRATVRAACGALGLTAWEDPHNADPSFARARVRALLPDLARALGQDVTGNLARTAKLLAADNAVLDALAEDAAGQVTAADGSLDAVELGAYPDAVRTRVLHRFALSLGVAGAALSARHVAALDALVTSWSGQGPVHLPGGIEVIRRVGALRRLR